MGDVGGKPRPRGVGEGPCLCGGQGMLAGWVFVTTGVPGVFQEEAAIVSPGSVGSGRGDVGARGVGCCGGSLQGAWRVRGGQGRGDLGCIGSTHTREPECGRREDAGGWEVISWSLVSLQSLDASPCLAASSLPAPPPTPQSYCGSPICPRVPSSPPGTVRQSSLGSSHHCQLGWGRGQHRNDGGGQRRLLVYL